MQVRGLTVDRGTSRFNEQPEHIRLREYGVGRLSQKRTSFIDLFQLVVQLLIH